MNNEKTCNFLLKNGFKEEELINETRRSFYKENLVQIEVDEDSIAFISDEGDFLTIPNNYFALIGALIIYRLIPINFET